MQTLLPGFVEQELHLKAITEQDETNSGNQWSKQSIPSAAAAPDEIQTKIKLETSPIEEDVNEEKKDSSDDKLGDEPLLRFRSAGEAEQQ